MAKVLITAGPTHEYLDDVRYLANASSGRMGYALARAAVEAGHQVLLVSGPTALPAPEGVERIDVVSAREMHDRALAGFGDCDLAFGVAAVADFRPSVKMAGKPSKTELAAAIELKANPDVVAALGAIAGPRRLVVAFALEAFAPDDPGEALQRARAKLERKNCDLCALNAAEAMGSADNRLWVVDADGLREDIGPADKDEIARRLLALSLDTLQLKRSEEASR